MVDGGAQSQQNIKKNKELKLACQGGLLEAGRKYIKNENFLYYQMQRIPTKKTFKGVIRSRVLALATTEEMSAALGKQGVTNIRKIFIRKGEERIQTNFFIPDI